MRSYILHDSVSVQSSVRPVSSSSPVSFADSFMLFTPQSVIHPQTDKSYYYFSRVRIKVTAAISADFVCLPSGLPLCLCSWIHTRVCTRLEDRHWRNCWQDVPLTVSDTISCLLHVPQRDDCVPHSLGSVTTNSFPPLARY